jgi:hypothetical protein
MASGRVSWRAAPSGLKVVARRTASRTEGASGASTRAVPSPPEVARSIARRTAAASSAKRWAAPSLLLVTWGTAVRMAGASAASTQAASRELMAGRNTASRVAAAGGASTWAAPRLLLQAAQPTPGRMAEVSAASRRAAPSQSFKLPAVCTAGYAHRASSPTMRRRVHRNSLVMRRRPKPWLGSKSPCKSSRRYSGGRWTLQGSLRASDRS